MKIKNFLISGILGLACLFNFSSAENYTFTYNGGLGYTPETFTTDVPLNELQVDYQCDGSYCYFSIMTNDGNYTDLCQIIYDDGVLSTCNYDGVGSFVVGGVDSSSEINNGNFATITLSDGQSSGGGEGGQGGTGGIIENGVGAFSGIITKLTGISGEFIPYIIYIAIALLGISLTINVVKYILGYLKGESTSTMQERRRRRRQQRRKKYDYKGIDYKGGRYYYTDIGKGLHRRSRKIQNGRIRNNGGF